jgi:protein involved in polysaccharide export with SLBB domain
MLRYGKCPSAVVKDAVVGALVLIAFQTAAWAKSDGIILLDPEGKERTITADEVDKLGGENPPYLLQIGDAVSVAFRIASLRENEPAWDYRIEVGDSMEVRVSPEVRSAQEYLVDVGDVIAITFLDNWELSVTRTVRIDGRITAPEVGDVEAAGKTASQLRDELKRLYAKSGILQGEPKITVNVDFVNLDRFENLSRDLSVRANGSIRLPQFTEDVQVAGLTVSEACKAVEAEAGKILRNRPVVSLNIFPAVNARLNDMKGTVIVQPDGKASVPGLPAIQSAGYSIDEFREELSKACVGLCYNRIDPMVSLVKATGARIYVGGEVKLPGVYPLDASPTVLQALLMAQGLTNDSRMRSVIVLRRNPGGKPFLVRTDLKAAVAKGQTENDFTLRAFDVVFVPMKRISRMDLAVDQYVNKLIPFNKTLGVSASYYTNTQKVDAKYRVVDGFGGSSIVNNFGFVSPTP